MLKGIFGIGNSCVDVGHISFCDPCNESSTRRVEILEIFPRAGLVFFSANPQFAGVHLSLSTSMLLFLRAGISRMARKLAA